jgi:carboxypeptidase Taq
MLAAQLNEAIEEDLDVDAAIRNEDFDDILAWHGRRIHRHGQRLTTPELIRSATGGELRVDAYLDRIDAKLHDVYDVRM